MTADPIEGLRTRLLRFRGDYPRLCRESGLKYSWVTKFANGERGQRPSFGQITRLTEILDQLESEDTPTAPAPTN